MVDRETWVKREQHGCRLPCGFERWFPSPPAPSAAACRQHSPLGFRSGRKPGPPRNWGFPRLVSSKAKVAVDFLSQVTNVAHLTTLPCPWGKELCLEVKNISREFWNLQELVLMSGGLGICYSLRFWESKLCLWPLVGKLGPALSPALPASLWLCFPRLATQ